MSEKATRVWKIIPIKPHFGFVFSFHLAYACFHLYCWPKEVRFPLNLISILEAVWGILELKPWNMLFCWMEQLVTIYLPFTLNSLRSYWKLLLKRISCPQLLARDNVFYVHKVLWALKAREAFSRTWKGLGETERQMVLLMMKGKWKGSCGEGQSENGAGIVLHETGPILQVRLCTPGFSLPRALVKSCLRETSH